jgi:exodeoxyribonuclease VIII
MSDKTFDIMLDLETMGTGPNADIVAIGAVAFDIQAGTIGDRFYRVVDLGTSVDMGGEIDADTVLWWMKQSDDARAMFTRDGVALSEALADFMVWLSSPVASDTVRMWGNGSAFDNVILSSAYRSSTRMQPWRHWNDRCYRTVKSLYPDVKLERVGTHHNAVDDAESQARHLIAMLGGQAQ